MKEPQPRYCTKKASLELPSELELPYDEFAQDWPWEVVNPDNIEKYIAHYSLLENEDAKFALMEAILQASEEKDNVEKYWPKIRKLLLMNFHIHEYSIFYWCSFENNIENAFNISSKMRMVAKEGSK